MATALAKYKRHSRRRKRTALKTGQRLDIQGLRMVAVLTVFASHLWGWPQGGFVGVDVFFVISGFLITGNLMRDAETRGNVSFRRFYWNRIRRIVPAATVVLVLTTVAALLLFAPFRAEQVRIDAVWAFFFASNWRFASNNTDYFTASDTVSPVQHYWSLSIEEQFYFVWPLLIFAIGLVVARKAWTHQHRMRVAGLVMIGIVASSLGWALYETTTNAAYAYFNTFSRVWELGVGALIACAIGGLARIPDRARPVLSWAGLALIAASVALISDEGRGFPAPWALLPIAGAALVIAAGVRREPRHQGFLRNPVSGYIGDISYSLYLVHWPVIVLLGYLMDRGPYYSVVVVTASFGLAIASYHLVEQPLRRADAAKVRALIYSIRKRRYQPQRSSGLAAFSALTLITVATLAFTTRPEAYDQPATPPPAAQVGSAGPATPELLPLAAALQTEITGALQATAWPSLDPPMEQAIAGPMAPSDVKNCGGPRPPEDGECTWGSPEASTRVVLVGDSIAITYAGPLQQLALESGGQIQFHLEAMGGCQFSEIPIHNQLAVNNDACPARKQHAIDYINATRPTVVIVSNTYDAKERVDDRSEVGVREWGDSMVQIVEKFRASVGKVVWLAAPPADKDIAECYGTRSSTPAACISVQTRQWAAMARTEQQVADQMGGSWVDSRPWFCDARGLCPAFVGATPTKRDKAHITEAYGQKIRPIIAESLIAQGII